VELVLSALSALGWNAKKLAAESCVAQSAISRFLNGSVNFKVESTYKILSTLGLLLGSAQSPTCRPDCPFKNCSPKIFQLCKDAAEVLQSKRETFSVALTSNILAFKEAVQQVEASSRQAEELAGIKARLKKLEDEKRENTPEPESDPGFPPSGDVAATAGGN